MVTMTLTDSESRILRAALFAKRNSYSQSLAKTRMRIAAAHDVGAEPDWADVSHEKHLVENLEMVDRMTRSVGQQLKDQDGQGGAENE